MATCFPKELLCLVDLMAPAWAVPQRPSGDQLKEARYLFDGAVSRIVLTPYNGERRNVDFRIRL